MARRRGSELTNDVNYSRGQKGTKMERMWDGGGGEKLRGRGEKDGEIKRGEMRDNNDCQHDDKNRVGALDRQNIKVNFLDRLFNHEGNKWQTVALMEPLDWSTYVHYLVGLFTLSH